MRIRLIASVFVLAPIAVVVAAAWQARDAPKPASTVVPIGSGVLAGQVLTDTARPQPVRRATVRLEGEAGTSTRLVGTDDEGRFVFDRLPAGRFTLSSSKPGYVTSFHGAKHPGRGPGIPVAVIDGQRVDVTLKVLPGAVITGVITEASGRPAAGVGVAAVNVRPPGGGTPVPARAVTDDLGVYRIFGLPPGEYLVSAIPRLVPASEGRGASSGGSVLGVTDAELQWARAGGAAPPAGRLVTYAPVFYPGTTDPSSAATIRVASGEERADVSLQLQIVFPATIAGALVDASGQPVSPATVSLLPRRADQASPVEALVTSGALVLPRAVVFATGFTITNVAPGNYTLVARTGSGQRGAAVPQPGTTQLWSVTDLTVDGTDRSDLVLHLLPGLVISGSMVFKRTALVPPADKSAVEVTLAATQAIPGITATPRAIVNADGTFRFSGVAPGNYVLRADPPAAVGSARWILKSAMVNGRDLADRPLQVSPGGDELSGLVVTFTDRAAEISGRLIDASGAPVTAYSIVVFTEDRSLWLPNARRVRLVQPATDGSFAVTGLPGGEYAIAAADGVEASDLADPALLLQLLPSAIKVTLGEGERKKQDLRVGAG